MTRTKRFTFLARILLCALLLNFTASAFAAISVTGSGAGPLTFSGPFLADVTNGWTTLTVGANATTIITTPAMDAAVQARNANTIVTTLGFSPTLPPSANAIARWNSNSAALYLQSVPTGNDYTLLLATLQNDTGGDVGTVTVNYNYGVLSTPAEDAVRGFRAFYSLSGTPNSWTLIPEFSSDATTTLPAGAKTATFSVVWPSGSPLYILWADDNGSGTEAILTIDDFAVSTVPLNVTAINITTQPTNTTAAERGPVTFSVAASGAPQSIYWRSNGVPIDGANGGTYSIAATPFSANGAVFSAIVSNVLGAVFSDNATLTVTADTTPPTAVVANATPDGTQVIVTFSEAMNPIFGDNSSFIVYDSSTSFESGEPPTTALFNGNTITLTLNTPLADQVNYSVYIGDLADTSLGVAEPGNSLSPNPTFLPIRRNLALVDFDGPNNVWSYATNVFGLGWETVGYDDSAWLTGQAGIGRDASVNGVPIRTPEYAVESQGTPYFFRRHFFLPSSTNGVTLSMRHVFEDGAVVFINGQEAGRYNVSAGPLTAGTFSTGNATDPTPISAPVSLPLTNVVPGDNVIAVVVYQSAIGSTDMEFALELTANIGEFAAGPVVINVPPQSQTVVEGAAASFSVSASGALPLTYQWRKDGSPILGATFPTFNITNVLPSDGGNYDVLVSNATTFAASAPGVLTVTADLTAPAFVSAVGSTNLTNITLTIYDAYGLNPVAAQNPAHYSVAGPNSLTIESAVLVNGSNVVLTTSPRTQSQSYTVTLSGVVDRSAAASAATPASRPLLGGLVIFAPDDSTLWRYDSSSNNLDGTGWQLTGYNDSAWPTALAGFTTSNNLEVTAPGFELRTTNLLAPNVGGPVTTYYRVPFNFPGTPGTARLHIVGAIDDGLVAYINGVEAGRLRITNSPVSFTNLATGASPETSDVHGIESVELSTAALLSGNNLLSIELHQNSATSTDALLSIQLVGEIVTFLAAGPTLHLVDNGNGTVTLTWTGGGTLQRSTDLSSPANWANVPAAPTSPFTTAASGSGTFYRVVVP